MTGSSLQFTLLNTTTIENISRKTIVWTLAVHVPRPSQLSSGIRTISFSTAQIPASPELSNTELAPDAIKTFAILHSKPGENPWDLGAFRNFKAVMGEQWYEWILPFKHSPCSRHEWGDSEFATGPVVQQMRMEAGIALPDEVSEEKVHRKHRRRRRRRRRRSNHSRVYDLGVAT